MYYNSTLIHYGITVHTQLIWRFHTFHANWQLCEIIYM